MKRLSTLILLAVLVTSCGVSSPSSLYYWGGTSRGTSTYEDLGYRSYKEQTPQVVCSLICAYEDMVSNPGGLRQVPPPGICAEYAYLLLQEDTPSIFATNATESQRKVFESSDYASLFKEKAEALFAREIELYPESQTFIVPLVRNSRNDSYEESIISYHPCHSALFLRHRESAHA